jgi:alkylhydroperoxidase family enzyme
LRTSRPEAHGAHPAGRKHQDLWDEVARHYDEPALAALIIAIANINVWNRINVTTRQVAGEWTG